MRTETNLPATVRRIVLTGFMGAGKSTVGALLAQRLGWRFLDSDTVIEARMGTTVAEIFSRHGEEVFRALETETIRDHCSGERLVLARGGGAVQSSPTREALARLDQTCVVFLDAPLAVMVARCIAEPGAAERPVLADRDRLSARLTARLPHYRDAHLTVPTADLTPDAVVEIILEALHDRCVGLSETTRQKEGFVTR